MNAGKYTASNPLWEGIANVPAGTSFEYKYFRKESDGSVVWETGSNRQAGVGKACSGGVTLKDSWRN